MLTTSEKSMLSDAEESSSATANAPDWLNSAIDPAFSRFSANDAFMPIEGRITPRQLGPTSAIPYCPAIRFRSCSSA